MGGKGSGSMKKGMPARKGSGAELFKAQSGEGLDPDVMSNITAAAIDTLNLTMQPFDITDDEQLLNRINDWLQICQRHGTKPLLTGLASAICIDERQLWNIACNGNRSPGGTGRAVRLGDRGEEILKKVYANVKEIHFQAGLDYKSGMQPAMGIFTAKNWYGYKDVQDVAVSARSPLDDTDQDAATIVAKYLPEEGQATIDVEPERLSDE